MKSTKKLTTEEFIEKSKKIHDDKYDYSLVNYINAASKVKIICPEHGVFEQTANNHLRNRGCPFCGGTMKLNTDKFIHKSKKIHGEKYDYSQVEYINNKIKVKIICPKHGIFEQIPLDHITNKSGCSICGGTKKSTTEEFIEKAKNIHENKYDYSLVNYINRDTKVKIICKKHGVFEQIPHSHLGMGGSGCSKCGGGVLSNTENFIEKSKEIHGDIYDYSLVNYVNAKSKVKIICKKHSVFEQESNSHLHNHGCPMCSDTKKYTKEDFIKKSKLIHGDKYNYSLVKYKGNKSKVKIICPEHGEFEKLPTKHYLDKEGCPKCSKILNKEKNQIINFSLFIENSNKIHKNKYDYSQVNYIDSNIKVDIICSRHGVFKQSPHSHSYGSGCPKCSNEKCSECNSSDTNTFINKSKIKHNNRYDYSLVNYINANTKVEIICKKHGIFEQLPSVHLVGCGCSLCQISKGEEKVKLFLDKNKIIYKKEHKFNDCRYKLPLPFDFYLPKYNMCIEYDGQQHFEKWYSGDTDEDLNIRKLRDQIKTDYCKNNNINLLRIKYDKFNKIDHILTEKLKNNN